MTVDSRKRHEGVLAIIVRRYVETAQPVSSRYVARQLGLSSATIRNVMADLEDLGMITHPHTSAGRAPTDKGYRYYIDSLMRLRQINESVIKSIRDEYQKALRSLDDMMERTAHLMSHLTKCIGITLFTQYEKVYLDGASYIVEQPEFKDLKKLHTIMKWLEEKGDILNLLTADLENEDLTIHIGRENRFRYLSECSIVTRGYKMRGKLTGRVGVIGPKRMVYEKVIPAVEFLADTVTKLLEGSEWMKA